MVISQQAMICCIQINKDGVEIVTRYMTSVKR